MATPVEALIAANQALLKELHTLRITLYHAMEANKKLQANLYAEQQNKAPRPAPPPDGDTMRQMHEIGAASQKGKRLITNREW